MPITRTRVAGALCAATLLLAACGSGEDDEPAATSTATSSADTPTGSATSSPTSDAAPTTQPPPETSAFEPEDKGSEQAVQAVVDFVAMRDRLSQDPDVPVQDLAQVAVGQALQQWVSNMQTRRDNETVQQGDTAVTVLKVETHEDEADYQVTACLDWSEVTANGKKPDRPGGDFQQATYRVQQDPTTGELKVTEDPMDYEPCGNGA